MRRKKIKNKKKKRIFLLIFLLILILTYILFFSPVFKIRHIGVNNNEEVSLDQIKDNFSYGNIFLRSNNSIKHKLLEKIPKIASIEIKKNFFKRSIVLKIQERQRLGIVCNSTCFYIDKQGVVFENAPQTSGSLILLINDYTNRDFNINKNVFDKKIIDSILEIKEYLLAETNIKALNFNVEIFPITEIKVIVNEGWYILFDLERDIKKQLLSLKAVLQEKIQQRDNLEYIDLNQYKKQK